ncbi:MAG TPA: GNAT family N-acetyltransferase [Blastocatellia bacterium]
MDTFVLRQGSEADAAAIAGLVNVAFLVEKFFVDGDRIAPDEVKRLLGKGSFWLIEEHQSLTGCVYVELKGERAYMGLLSVAPSRQGAGFGRRLVAAAEKYASDGGCKFMDLRAVNVRSELVPFYVNLGYREEGISPFPPEVPTKIPCHFILMAKSLIDAAL